MEYLKDDVKEFWNKGSCGEVYAQGDSKLEYYESARKARYGLEPYIPQFAEFNNGKDKDILEIGVGMGGDHAEWAKAKPRTLTGIDLTTRAIQHTKRRFESLGLQSKLEVGDAENLPYTSNSFDLVYSWGVLHHSPNTRQAIEEVLRVLRPGGVAKVMIYHTRSITGFLLWCKYALFEGHPLKSLEKIYAKYLESPGTKAYMPEEAKRLFASFSQVEVKVQLGFSDLLQGEVGQRHKGALLWIAKKIWPRRLLKFFFNRYGLYLLITAVK